MGGGSRQRKLHFKNRCDGQFLFFVVIGGMGVDFSHSVDTIGDAVDKVAKGILPYGVTSMCPTIVTSIPEVYHKVQYMLCHCLKKKFEL